MDKNKKHSTITHEYLIGFGMIIGSLISLIILVIFFGNGKEVMCVIPVVFLGFIIIVISDRRIEKKNREIDEE